MKKDPESILYPRIETWLRKHFLCFKTAINKGIRLARIDVIGIRDAGGELSGEVETIAVEVKRGTGPFANACGQTLGYSAYANRVYLADRREAPFTIDEIDLASHLGIGLIQISRTKCSEVRSSPFYKPMTKLHFALLERLRLGRCQLCSSLFEIGDAKRFSKVSRDISDALATSRGFIFGNQEVAQRKKKLGVQAIRTFGTDERRFICSQCVSRVFGQLNGQA